MSEPNIKKPETKEEFTKVLTKTAEKEARARTLLKGRPTKPTISGTAKLLNVHRDTLYTWLREFNVDFKEIADVASRAQVIETVGDSRRHAYFIGEALVGEGNEVAHTDLLVGDKEGPVGKAFAAGLSHLSMGHTPLLAVIRPNLPPKPHTLLVPKVTVKNSEDTNKIFRSSTVSGCKGCRRCS